jgi:hypothetical protein
MKRELYDAIERKLSTNPYHVVSSSRKKQHPTNMPSAIEQGLPFNMVNVYFRHFDKAVRPRNAKPIVEPSVKGLWDLVRSMDDEKKWEDAIALNWIRLFFHVDHRGYSFFVTVSGFTGVGPKDLKAGGKIVLLYGSQYPVAIRRAKSGNWHFVGFLYVRGLMEGEIWDCFKDMEWEEREFVFE